MDLLITKMIELDNNEDFLDHQEFSSLTKRAFLLGTYFFWAPLKPIFKAHHPEESWDELWNISLGLSSQPKEILKPKGLFKKLSDALLFDQISEIVAIVGTEMIPKPKTDTVMEKKGTVKTQDHVTRSSSQISHDTDYIKVKPEIIYKALPCVLKLKANCISGQRNPIFEERTLMANIYAKFPPETRLDDYQSQLCHGAKANKNSQEFSGQLKSLRESGKLSRCPTFASKGLCPEIEDLKIGRCKCFSADIEGPQLPSKHHALQQSKKVRIK